MSSLFSSQPASVLWLYPFSEIPESSGRRILMTITHLETISTLIHYTTICVPLM